MKAVVAAFNQEKALVGAFSVITNLRMELFQAPATTLIRRDKSGVCAGAVFSVEVVSVISEAAAEQAVIIHTNTCGH